LCYSSLSALLIKCSRPLNVAVCALRGSSATLVSIVLAILNNIADTVTQHMSPAVHSALLLPTHATSEEV
ncbi:hypothetical protein, partial [Methylicorpusculum sp.]|uniref:hypothetical protein n=1 Tax=Methylicorpusculum sp. TaxID=2713644 RepID=UPI002735EE10